MLPSKRSRWRAVREWVGGLELLVLVAAAVMVLGAWGFIELADEVAEGDSRKFDESILRSLRNPMNLSDPRGPRWLEVAIRDITVLGGYTVLILVTAAAVGYLHICGKSHAAWLVLGASVGGLLLCTALKGVQARPRPDLVPHLTQVSDASFPSGHAMLSAVIYLTLGSLLVHFIEAKRLKFYVIIVALTLTLLIGVSRIYLGVHYPTDVLAGWSAGLAWALFCWLVGRYLQHHAAVEKPAP